LVSQTISYRPMTSGVVEGHQNPGGFESSEDGLWRPGRQGRKIGR
jgi:hypothetical protein